MNSETVHVVTVYVVTGEVYCRKDHPRTMLGTVRGVLAQAQTNIEGGTAYYPNTVPE